MTTNGGMGSIAAPLLALWLGSRPEQASSVEDMEDRDLQQMLAWTDAHDLKFALVSELIHPSTSIPLGSHASRLQHEYTELSAGFDRYLELAAELDSLFEQQGLPILFIKSFLTFPYVDSNLDTVAVEQDNRRAYRRHLTQTGFKRVRDLADLREPGKEFYARHVGSQRASPIIHLHSRISWNGIPYMDAQEVYARRRYWQHGAVALPIPSPEDELLIAAAHAIFENKYVLLRDVFYLSHLASPHALDWEYLETVALTFNWRSGLCAYLKRIHQIVLRIPLNTTLGLPSWSVRGPANPPLTNPQLTAPLPILWPFRNVFRVAMEKMLLDIKDRKMSRFPRQLFSYLFVDYFWTYRRHLRRQRAYSQR